MSLREDADKITAEAIHKVMPDEAVRQVLQKKEFGSRRIYVVAAGKAAWQMAKAASGLLGSKIEKGMVITKYDHVKGEIDGMACYEAGHPVPDENSFAATQAALDLVKGLRSEDTVLFLLSGGSDGTDGPTDAAGGYCDGTTKEKLAEKGININDVAVLLIKRG